MFPLTWILCFFVIKGIIEKLEELDDLQWPEWLTTVAPFLPPIDLRCVSESGIDFLQNDLDISLSSVTGFFGAIAEGCSSDQLRLGGGYNSTSSELAMNVVINLQASADIYRAIRSVSDAFGYGGSGLCTDAFPTFV